MESVRGLLCSLWSRVSFEISKTHEDVVITAASRVERPVYLIILITCRCDVVLPLLAGQLLEAEALQDEKPLVDSTRLIQFPGEIKIKRGKHKGKE
jgi:hypothetical protein